MPPTPQRPLFLTAASSEAQPSQDKRSWGRSANRVNEGLSSQGKQPQRTGTPEQSLECPAEKEGGTRVKPEVGEGTC